MTSATAPSAVSPHALAAVVLTRGARGLREDAAALGIDPFAVAFGAARALATDLERRPRCERCSAAIVPAPVTSDEDALRRLCAPCRGWKPCARAIVSMPCAGDGRAPIGHLWCVGCSDFWLRYWREIRPAERRRDEALRHEAEREREATRRSA